ncbi:MAG: response regulator [Lachnospiraceae bacterium]|nr:response regulator [Lachnospiraceae bacterium]
MNQNIRRNELFQASHLMILISYSIFSIVLIGEALLMSWEGWALILVGIGVISSWGLHITQSLSDFFRLWLYSILMMGTFFFYGIHATSTFDLAPVMTAVIMLYTMTGVKGLVLLCQISYYVTMGYDIVILLKEGQISDSLTVTRILLHLALVMMVGWISRIIINKWNEVLLKSDEEIAVLEDSTNRLNDFLANVSHEIRTPVNAIIGLTGICLDQEKDEKIADSMKSVQEAGKRVAEQISDILDFSEIDRGNLAVSVEDYMLSSLLNDLMMELRMFKEPEIELVIDVDPEIPNVMNTDVTKLKKILWHLIVNGLKYTKKGGVYVRLSAIEQEYGMNLCIEVTDTGIGMDDLELERIFEQFYQADSGRTRSTSGLGLGMSIVSGFVRALGGFITIDSRPDMGTTVHVSIPQRVVDHSECMMLADREKISLGGFLHFDKFPVPSVREFYNSMVYNMVRGLKLHMHRVDRVESLKELVENIELTHLFGGEEEYRLNTAYLDELSQKMLVVVVANESLKLSEHSKARLLKKPFYCFPVISILDSDLNTEIFREGAMHCPGVRALVVDDEPMNLTVAKGIFKRYDMTVTTASSGQESIELCSKQEFDIVFMDHMMPGMDGIEAMKQIKANAKKDGRDFPVVALTANAVSSAKEMFLSEGFDGFVSKPIELVELERVVRRVLPKTSVVFETGSETGQDLNGQGRKKEDSTQKLEKDAGSGVYTKLQSLGINTAKGLHYCQNDEDFYKTLLLQFAEESEEKRKNMEFFLEKEELSKYAILVHALKSTAKMIGSMELSEKAKALEFAAKEGNTGFIHANHEEMYKEYLLTTKGILAVYGKAKGKQEEAKEDADEILEFFPEEEEMDFSPVEEEAEVMEFSPVESEGAFMEKDFSKEEG